RDGNLVALEIDVDGHRPVQAGLRTLDPPDRRDVAFGVGVVDGDRRLVEVAAGERRGAGARAAPPPRRRGPPRRLAAPPAAGVGADDLVVLPVEEDAVRIAEAGLWPPNHAQRRLASFGLLPVDHDLPRRFDGDRELVALLADRQAPRLVRDVEHALRLDVAG